MRNHNIVIMIAVLLMIVAGDVFVARHGGRRDALGRSAHLLTHQLRDKVRVSTALGLAGGVLAAVVLMRTSGAVAALGPVVPPLRALRDGLRFVFRTPIMVWTTGLDFVATVDAG